MRKLVLSALQLAFTTVFCFIGAEGAKVIGIGNAAVDLIIPIEEHFLSTIGFDKGCSQHIDWPTFCLLPKPQKIASGGSSANTMKGLAKLGVEAAFLGKTGMDDMGDFFAQRLLAHNVQPFLLQTSTPNMLVACLITPDGQRSMLIYPGAAMELCAEDLRPELFTDVVLVHTDAHLLANQNLFSETLRTAKAMGKLVSVDLGCAELMHACKDLVLELLPKYADIVFGNEGEIEALTGKDVMDGLEDLRRLCPLVIAKVAEQGCWVATEKEVFHSPGIPVKKIVDTTGAGDLFATGFLFGYLKGCPLHECARYGNIVGSAAVETYGAEIPESRWVTIREQLYPSPLVIADCKAAPE